MAGQSDNPGEFLRNLVLYAPLGALLILKDQAEAFLSEAIERGRKQQRQVDAAVNNQVSIAKSVGKRQMQKVIDEVDLKTKEAPFSAVRKIGNVVAQQVQQAAADTVAPVRDGSQSGEDLIRRAQERMGSRLARAGRNFPPAYGSADREDEGSGLQENLAARTLPDIGGSGHLAIEDYESLSAAQISTRLGGLSVEELEAVADYESKHRGRKSVLARVQQELKSRA